MYDLHVLNDLHMKALLFDMTVDLESLTLEPKTAQTAPKWLTDWKTKQLLKDFDERMDIDRE